MPWFPGITTNRQKEHRPSLWSKGGGGTVLGMHPAGDSLIKLPLPDMLKGEGEELETGPGVEFILEFHPV